jgi:glycerol uptake facilitator-like aquaporin
MAICFSGSLCGANLNPVITISNCLKKESKYKKKLLLCYIPAQILGAFAGLAWAEFLGHKVMKELEINGGDEIFKIMANETMGIFILVLFTLLLSNPNTTFIESELSGYISIAIFYHIARSFAPIAGVLINPAVTISISIQYAIAGKFASLSNCWVWLLGDIFGCIIAVLFYTNIYEPIIKEIR